ncbi:MAG TPA: HEAT repeat domain-containing protein [Myxococcaceae bacterium]|nr:HEAT repeat domain-containing protein [Myxococcaceae bacterium]
MKPRRWRPDLRRATALLLLARGVASADGDARWSFLVRQLGSAQDPRARVQAAMALGATEEASALEPLCAALRDPVPLVRAAAAKSLPRLHETGALDCLLAHGEDADPLARAETAQAVAAVRALGERSPRIHVAVLPVVDASDPPADPALVALARSRLLSRLRWLGAEAAAEPEDRSAARTQLRGFQLRARLVHRGPEVSVAVVCLTYPEQEVLGEVTGRATGGRPEDALRALVPHLLQDLAATFEWNL